MQICGDHTYFEKWLQTVVECTELRILDPRLNLEEPLSEASFVKRPNRWHLQPGHCQTSVMKTIWEPGQIFQTCPATMRGEYCDPMWLSVILHTLQACMHTTYTCLCIHTYMHTCACTHTHAHAHKHTHTHTHKHTHTHTHTWMFSSLEEKKWILEMICVGWLYLSKTFFFH